MIQYISTAIEVSPPSASGIRILAPRNRVHEARELRVRIEPASRQLIISRAGVALASVPIEPTAVTFGSRSWYRCPRCNGRCGKIYVGAVIACRKCSGLRYESQSRSERKTWKAMKAATGLSRKELKELLRGMGFYKGSAGLTGGLEYPLRLSAPSPTDEV